MGNSKKRTPRPHELKAIVAIRWFANSIENLALQRYMGNIDRLDQINGILSRTMDELERTKKGIKSETDCPFPPCDDMCVPRCPRPAR